MKAAENPVYALTTYELDARRSALEHAIREIPPSASVPECLREDLAEVIAEQEQRSRIQQFARRKSDQDHYCVRQQTTAELESVKRQLQANLGLIAADSPARVPIQAHLRAIDSELADRADGHLLGGLFPVSVGREPISVDPLSALDSEYGAEWKVWRPGRYVADHRRFDVTLISDSVPELAEKLRAFTELIKDRAYG